MKNAVLALALVLGLAGQALAAELTVSAAASLAEAFADIKAAFEKAHPGAVVVLNFAASGALYRQMRQGAPVDVFASANRRYLDLCLKEGLVRPATVREFAANDLVLAVPAGDPAGVRGLDGLVRGAVGRIGLGDPATVPAGQYARAALTAAGLWRSVAPKCVFGESVRQILDYLRRGEVDAAFIYATDAAKAGSAVAVVAVVPERLVGESVNYPAAVAAAAPNPEAAALFVEYLGSPEAAALLAARGFRPPSARRE